MLLFFTFVSKCTRRNGERTLEKARTIAANIAQSYDVLTSLDYIRSDPLSFVLLLTDNRELVNGKTRTPN